VSAQERIRIPDDKMKYYENLAEMYVGDDVSPDFYGALYALPSFLSDVVPTLQVLCLPLTCNLD
jgi:hypothetical protein